MRRYCIAYTPGSLAFGEMFFLVTQGPQGFRKGRKKKFIDSVIYSHYPKAPVFRLFIKVPRTLDAAESPN